MTDPAPRHPEAGFTLIEALIAMAVLAVGAIGLLGTTERHLALSGGLADRVVARWVAENRLAELSLGLGAEAGRMRLDGRDWPVAHSIQPTSDARLAQFDVRVFAPGTEITEASALVSLTGFAYVPATKEQQ